MATPIERRDHDEVIAAGMAQKIIGRARFGYNMRESLSRKTQHFLSRQKP